ncbi:hypothetical protein Tco_0099773 [Tanacetum coccineum]
MSFSKRQGNDVVCYTKPLDSLKGWNDHFFWVDAFACPASFSWHTSKSVSRDHVPKSSEFNAEHYATLVAYPASFHKYPEPFLCLVGLKMDLFSFIRTADPTNVRIGERQRAEDEPKLLDTTIGRGGNGNQAEQGDSASGGDAVGIQLVNVAAETIDEDVAPVQPRRQRKRKTVVVDDGEPSHPAKRLRDDHGTPGGPTVGGKSRSAVQRLLVGAVQNVEIRDETIPTLPFVTSSVSATWELEDGDHTESLVGTNLREVDSFARPFVLLMTVATTVTSTVDPTTTVKEKIVGSSIFCGGSSSAGGADHTVGGFSDLTGSDFIVGGIRNVISLDTDLQKVYVPQWSVTNGSRLDDGRACLKMVDEFSPPKFFALICGMEHDQLFTKFNVGAARQMSLSAEARDEEVESLKAQLLVNEAEAAEAIRLRAEASKFKVVEKSLQDEAQVLKERNTTLEKEKSELEVKVADLAASVKVREQEVADLDAIVTSVKSQNDNLVDRVCVFTPVHIKLKFYPHLLTTISGRRWLLTHGMELAIAKCLNSTEYLSTLGAAIGKAVEKGMQDGLSVGITHGAEGRNLTDVAAYNPSAEANYISALQRLQSVNFSLIAELRSNKDASIETIMSLLRLEDTLAEKLGLTESQPHVNQLMVPIHHSPDQTVVGATALSFSLDVSYARVRKIRENIANHRSALRDVFIPLAEPLFTVALKGTEGTSGITPDTTTALSVTLVSASAIPPISTDDYEVVPADSQKGTGADGEALVDENVDPFPDVSDAELTIP